LTYGLKKNVVNTNVYIYYTKMCLCSLWISLDFECIWTFLPGEIGQPLNEHGLVVMDDELVH
jgi:hypothetical protein